MEGLEISEVLYSYAKSSSNIFRVDSGFFQKQYIKDENVIVNKSHKTLLELENKILSFGAYSLNNHVEYLEDGIPFVRGINMKNGRIDFSNIIYISKQANSLLWKSEVKPKTILLSMSGTIGDVAISSENWNYPINSNQDIAKIHPNKNINSYYLYVFLLTKFGQNYLKREARGSVQQHVFLSQIENFKIPILKENFINNIEDLVLKIENKNETSKVLYTQAEKVLLEEVGLQDFVPSNEAVNIKSFSESFGTTGRIDAEYYQPKYEDYEKLIISQKHTFIEDEYLHITAKSKKNKKGYNYIEIGDVNTSDGSNKSNYVLTQNLPANAKTLVKKGDILISNVRPYRGAVTIINSNLDDLIVSGAFTVLRKDKNSVYNNQVLQVILRTSIYKDWLLKFNVGTSYPVIKDKDVLNLPIPFINTDKQEKIAALIEQSFALKKESEHLLEVAKKAVEMAIEQDEKTALEYIEQQVEIV